MTALHSAGDLLAFHPHIHGLFLAGVILPDGSFQYLEIDQGRLQAKFADKVLLALLAKGLLSEEDIDNMKSWEHSGFNVFIGEPINHRDKDRVLFAARYLKKCPLSNERLKIVEAPGAESYIEYASLKDGIKTVRTFTPLEFLAEVSQHIPDMWEQTTSVTTRKFFHQGRTLRQAQNRQILARLPLPGRVLLSLSKSGLGQGYQ